jgi:cytochrome c-type biogenesis protein CcsB
MKRIFSIVFFAALLGCITAANVRADQASASSDDFAAKVDLSVARTIVVQNMQTIKTIDSFSREFLEIVTGRSSYNGQDPVFTVFDIAYHPEDYQGANLIKIKNLPLRTDFRRLTSLSSDEQDRIVKTGLISMALFEQKDVQDMLALVESTDVRKAQSVQQVQQAYQLLKELSFTRNFDLLLPVAAVPPAMGSSDTTNWHRLIEVMGNDPQWAKTFLTADRIPAALPGYTARQLTPAFAAAYDFENAWQRRDAEGVKNSSVALAGALSQINPAIYPSHLTRQIEVTYNRLAKMTLPGAAFYFVAFVCFLMSASSGVTSLRLWGLRFFILGFAIHTIGIAIRWWLVGSIPIKNEFESVMFSAWFGAAVGLALELRFGRAIFGVAASFVGWLALIAIFTVPYVFHTSIGENIGQVNGVLMSYWLYIHVTMVTASYSMIGMGFILGTWWLVRYYMDYGTLSRQAGNRLEGSAHGFDPVFPSSGSSVALSPAATLAKLIFFPVTEAKTVKPAAKTAAGAETLAANSTQFLAALDACNLVVLQLAFWMLGTGIILGAVWADESWGRFWAWDPKETFALVTWIVYLIIVHVRVVTRDKAWWMSVLSIFGFFVMLFNWIGVNYFLPGLHSYAG